VLITGASSGIGRATARHFARSRLFVVGRDSQRLTAVSAETGATHMGADLADAADIARVAETIRLAAGRLDVLINCAGQLDVGPAEQLGAEAVERLMQVNFIGAARLIDACLPLLRAAHRPVIINVGSIAGLIAPPYMAAYAASKFALTGYTRALRQELRPEGIHVGLVLPAPASTPMVDGKLHGPYYRVPPGSPIVGADKVARAIVDAVSHRRREVFVPRRLSLLLRLGAAVPFLVDLVWLAMRAVPARPGRSTSAEAAAHEAVMSQDRDRPL
jgi:short-subunit dehydrogenase